MKNEELESTEFTLIINKHHLDLESIQFIRDQDGNKLLGYSYIDKRDTRLKVVTHLDSKPENAVEQFKLVSEHINQRLTVGWTTYYTTTYYREMTECVDRAGDDNIDWAMFDDKVSGENSVFKLTQLEINGTNKKIYIPSFDEFKGLFSFSGLAITANTFNLNNVQLSLKMRVDGGQPAKVFDPKLTLKDLPMIFDGVSTRQTMKSMEKAYEAYKTMLQTLHNPTKLKNAIRGKEVKLNVYHKEALINAINSADESVKERCNEMIDRYGLDFDTINNGNNTEYDHAEVSVPYLIAQNAIKQTDVTAYDETYKTKWAEWHPAYLKLVAAAQQCVQENKNNVSKNFKTILVDFLSQQQQLFKDYIVNLKGFYDVEGLTSNAGFSYNAENAENKSWEFKDAFLNHLSDADKHKGDLQKVFNAFFYGGGFSRNIEQNYKRAALTVEGDGFGALWTTQESIALQVVEMYSNPERYVDAAIAISENEGQKGEIMTAYLMAAQYLKQSKSKVTKENLDAVYLGVCYLKQSKSKVTKENLDAVYPGVCVLKNTGKKDISIENIQQASVTLNFIERHLGVLNDRLKLTCKARKSTALEMFQYLNNIDFDSVTYKTNSRLYKAKSMIMEIGESDFKTEIDAERSWFMRNINCFPHQSVCLQEYISDSFEERYKTLKQEQQGCPIKNF